MKKRMIAMVALVLMVATGARAWTQTVDLGLPSGVLWATCNVGADSPEDTGGYFAWGEPTMKERYVWNMYMYSWGGTYNLLKYCNDEYFGNVDNLTTLLPEDDVATAYYDYGWRMPTNAEWEELCNNTTSTWTTQNGVAGRLFTASNGKSLFLPAAGYMNGESNEENTDAFYWSSDLGTAECYKAIAFRGYDNASEMVYAERAYGLLVRAVISKEPHAAAYFGTMGLKDGTGDAGNWKVKAGDGELQALPANMEEGKTVTLKYSGRQRVKSVTAKKMKKKDVTITCEQGNYITVRYYSTSFTLKASAVDADGNSVPVKFRCKDIYSTVDSNTGEVKIDDRSPRTVIIEIYTQETVTQNSAIYTVTTQYEGEYVGARQDHRVVQRNTSTLGEDEVPLTRGTAAGEENTWTMDMPFNNVELTAEYWPVATLEGTATATEGVATGEDEALVTGLTAKGGTLVWAVTACDVTTAPADDVFDAANNTAKNLTEVGDYRVWYYVEGDAEHSPTEPAYKDVSVIKAGDFALSYEAATGLESVTFTVNGMTVRSADKDADVTVTVRGVEGYAASSLTATAGSSGTAVETEKTKGRFGVWTFTMPENPVNVTATMENVWGVGDEVDGSTEEKAFVISTTLGLDLLANNVNEIVSNYAGKFFKLGGDVEYSHTTDWNDETSTESNFMSIGSYNGYKANNFNGHFDGCGHTVKGIRIYMGGEDRIDVMQGFFGTVGRGGSVSHLTLDDVRITGWQIVGGIVGNNYGGIITDCHVTANVYIRAVKENATYQGGIVGWNTTNYGNGIVCGCTSRALIKLSSTIIGGSCFGGIAGYNEKGTIQDCLYLGGEVGGTGYVGAIAGVNLNGPIENCYYKTLMDISGNSNSNITAMDENHKGIGGNPAASKTKNVAYARTITLVGDVAISGTAYDYAEGVTTPAVSLTTYTPDGGTAPTAMKYATADGKAWLFSTEGTTLSLSYSGPTGEGYWFEEKATKTDGGDDVTGTNYVNGTLTVPAYDVTFTASGEDVWGIGEGANGEEEHPYIIRTTKGLDLLARNVNAEEEYYGTYFVLAADLDYSSVPNRFDPDGQGGYLSNYQPIGGIFQNGDLYGFFCGNFDGGGHTIKGITVTKTGNRKEDRYQGLFGQTNAHAHISHLTLDDSRITGLWGVGSIVGNNKQGAIIDCHVTDGVYIIATHNDATEHGGIVGLNHAEEKDAIIAGCTSAAHIIAAPNTDHNCYFGGIVGQNEEGIVKDCVYFGDQVEGYLDVGAIVGYNDEGEVQNCYFTTPGLKGITFTKEWVITSDDGIGSGIGNNSDAVASSNIGLARVVTLDDGVALDGTPTVYGVDGAPLTVTAYNRDDVGFALALTTGGANPTTTIYSVADAEVGVKYDGTLPDGAKPTFTVTKSQGGNVEVSETSGHYSFTMPTDGVSVSVLTGTTVSVAAQSWATFCIDQPVSLADGQADCGLYTLSAVGTESVTLSEITGTASAGTPLLLWNGSDTKQNILLTYAAAPATTTEHADAFKGTLAATAVSDITDATVYVLYNNMFVRATTGTIPANRAYIALAAGSGARQLVIGTATSMHNSQFTIHNEAGAIYDVSGRKVRTGQNAGGLRKGVYIQDGRKRVVR